MARATMPSDEAIEAAAMASLAAFDLEALKPLQLLYLRYLVRGQDVFACFPTGFGKSMIFHILPSVCSHLAASGFTRFPPDPIVLVVSPLKSLMRDQVSILSTRGISAAAVGDSKQSDSDIMAGKFSFVYGSPEVLAGSSGWRSALQEQGLRERFVAVVVDEAHTVVQWGSVNLEISEDEEEPFRVWCGLVGELRSILDVPCLALTATVSIATRSAISHALGLMNAVEIVKSPDRANIHLSVIKVTPDFQNTFGRLLELVQKLGITCPRILVYCRTQNDCSSLYLYFHHTLGRKAYCPEGNNKLENRLVEMYHSSTPEANKEIIQQSLRDSQGKCRVLFATNALGMGIDVKGLYTIIHYGPSTNLESYMQEIGRCGRDGGQSSAVLYYHGHQMQHTDAMMKAHVHNSSSCRRDLLLSVFGASSVPPRVQHKCCDICAKTCGCCDTEHCSGVMQPMLAGLSGSVDSSLKPNRSVSLTKMKLLEMALYAYKHRGEEMFIHLQQQPLYTTSAITIPLTDTNIQEILTHASALVEVDNILDLFPTLSENQVRDLVDIINYVMDYEE